MKKNIHLFVILLIVIGYFFSLLISPYKYEYDIELKQPNDDSILVLRLIYLILLGLSGVGLYLANVKKQNVIYLYVLIIFFIVFKVIYLAFR